MQWHTVKVGLTNGIVVLEMLLSKRWEVILQLHGVMISDTLKILLTLITRKE